MRRDIPSLTGLRFLAAACVLWAHSTVLLAGIPGAQFLRLSSRTGELGMTLFFVLSGFVIHYNYGPTVSSLRGRDVWAFAIARLARLYPLYLFALILDQAYFGNPLFADRYWPFFLTLTQSWLPIKFGDGQPLWTDHLSLSWSISTEVFLYLCYIALCRPLHALRDSRSTLIAIGALIVIATALYGAVLPQIPGWNSSDTWLSYVSPYCRVPEFLLGALTAGMFQTTSKGGGRFTGYVGAASLIWTLAVLFGLAWLPAPLGDLYERSWMLAPGCAGILYYLAVRRSVWSRVVEAPLILLLGEASYSIYLLQTFAIAAIQIGGGPAAWLGPYGWANPSIVAVKMAMFWLWLILWSLGTFKYLEVPARRWLRRLALPRKSPTIAPGRLGVSSALLLHGGTTQRAHSVVAARLDPAALQEMKSE